MTGTRCTISGLHPEPTRFYFIRLLFTHWYASVISNPKPYSIWRGWNQSKYNNSHERKCRLSKSPPSWPFFPISPLCQPLSFHVPLCHPQEVFLPKKVLKVTIWLPRAIRAVCLFISIHLENDFQWPFIAREEEVSQKSTENLSSNPISQNSVVCPFVTQPLMKEKSVPLNQSGHLLRLRSSPNVIAATQGEGVEWIMGS